MIVFKGEKIEPLLSKVEVLKWRPRAVRGSKDRLQGACNSAETPGGLVSSRADVHFSRELDRSILFPVLFQVKVLL